MQSMYNSVNGAGRSISTHKTFKRKKSLTKLGLSIMQAAVLFTGGILATSQASATTTICAGNPVRVTSPYWLSVWMKDATGCSNYYSGTNAAMTWNNPAWGGDFLGGLGFDLRAVGKYMYSVNTNANAWHNHKFSSTNTGRGSFQLYGWVKDVQGVDSQGTYYNNEWYIIEDWFGLSAPPKPTTSATPIATLSIDGGVYDIYKTDGTVTGHPTVPWHQWWSVRRTPRSNGTVAYAKHFEKWRRLGMLDGPMREMYFNVEANGPVGSGKLDIYSIDFTSNPM